MILQKLGVDQSKAYFDACLLCGDRTAKRRFTNNETGFRALSCWLLKQKAPKVHLCVEATGRYAVGLATYMHKNGHAVSIVNPARIKAHRQAFGVRNKTDKVDSMLIADYAQKFERKLRLWEPPSADMAELRDIVGQLAMCKKHRIAHENRARCGLVSDDMLALNRKLAGQLEQLQDELQKKAMKIIAVDAKLSRIYAIVDSVPGIGEVNALILTALIDWSAFKTGRDLAVFLGLAAKLSESGSTEKRSKVSKEGNSDIRAVLKMGAAAASRGEFFRKFSDRIRSKKGTKSEGNVINAVARKMILIAHACVRNDVMFNPNYAHPLAQPI